MGTSRRKGCEVCKPAAAQTFWRQGRSRYRQRWQQEKEEQRERRESEHKGHDDFITPKFGMDQHFIIVHEYSGEVSAQSVGGIWISIIEPSLLHWFWLCVQARFTADQLVEMLWKLWVMNWKILVNSQLLWNFPRPCVSVYQTRKTSLRQSSRSSSISDSFKKDN